MYHSNSLKIFEFLNTYIITIVCALQFCYNEFFTSINLLFADTLQGPLANKLERLQNRRHALIWRLGAISLIISSKNSSLKIGQVNKL